MANKIEEQLTASSLITAPEYMVCGVVLSSKLEMHEFARLEDLEYERDVIGMQVKIDRLQEKTDTVIRTTSTSEYQAQVNLIASWETSRDAKHKELSQPPFALSDGDSRYLADLEVAISAGYARLEAMPPPDHQTRVARTSQLQIDANGALLALRFTKLEYGHWLATQRKLTKDTFKAWQDKAASADYANLAELVRMGKALQKLTEALQHRPETPPEAKN